MRILIVINTLPYAEHVSTPILKSICFWVLSIYHKEDINFVEEITMAGTHPAKPKSHTSCVETPCQLHGKLKPYGVNINLVDF